MPLLYQLIIINIIVAVVMNIFSVRHIVHIVLFPIGSWEIILV